MGLSCALGSRPGTPLRTGRPALVEVHHDSNDLIDNRKSNRRGRWWEAKLLEQSARQLRRASRPRTSTADPMALRASREFPPGWREIPSRKSRPPPPTRTVALLVTAPMPLGVSWTCSEFRRYLKGLGHEPVPLVPEIASLLGAKGMHRYGVSQSDRPPRAHVRELFLRQGLLLPPGVRQVPAPLPRGRGPAAGVAELLAVRQAVLVAVERAERGPRRLALEPESPDVAAERVPREGFSGALAEDAPKGPRPEVVPVRDEGVELLDRRQLERLEPVGLRLAHAPPVQLQPADDGDDERDHGEHGGDVERAEPVPLFGLAREREQGGGAMQARGHRAARGQRRR